MDSELSDYIKIKPWGSRYGGDGNGKYWFSNVSGPKGFEHCKEKRCSIIDNVNESEVVIISTNSMAEFIQGFKLPHRKSSDQKWVFYALESPKHFPVHKEYLSTPLFNATFTYKSSSDIHHPYGKIIDRVFPYNEDFKKLWRNKKNVAWMVSNWRSRNRREDYVYELKKHIDVTIFGRDCPAGENATNQFCPNDDGDNSAYGKCNKQISDNFKFYLAFENSLCSEYITEKLYRTLLLETLPVVLGAADYKAVLPEKSYIDVRDFKSPKHLAEYLKVLSANVTLYGEYFQWKKKHEIVTHLTPSTTCDFCQYLHKTRYAKPHTVNMNKFWNLKNDCVNKEDFMSSVGVNLDKTDSDTVKKNLCQS